MEGGVVMSTLYGIKQLHLGPLSEGVKTLLDGNSRTVLVYFHTEGYKEIWQVHNNQIVLTSVRNYGTQIEDQSRMLEMENGMIAESEGYTSDELVEIIDLNF